MRFSPRPSDSCSARHSYCWRPDDQEDPRLRGHQGLLLEFKWFNKDKRQLHEGEGRHGIAWRTSLCRLLRIFPNSLCRKGIRLSVMLLAAGALQRSGANIWVLDPRPLEAENVHEVAVPGMVRLPFRHQGRCGLLAYVRLQCHSDGFSLLG